MHALPVESHAAPQAAVEMRRRLRIAVFSYGLPQAGVKRGGIERVAHDLAQGLAARGHGVTVFTYDPRPEGALYDVRPLPATRFVTSWLGRRLTMGYLGNVLALAPGYREYDVVMAHGDSLLLPVLGRPVLRVMHGSALEEARSATSWGRRILQTGVYLQELLTPLVNTRCVGVSENARTFNPFVRHVIPNGVDLERFRPSARTAAARPTILFVGALTGRKRGQFLLDLFVRDIRPRVPEAELVMVCPAGPAIDGVIWREGPSDEELARLYREAWVYASPSSYEGFGLPYVEAMASGIPVVATPNPGSIEVLDDGRCGVLADDGHFADEVVRLLLDANARHALAEAGLQRARHYSLDRTVEAYEQLLLELVDHHAG